MYARGVAAPTELLERRLDLEIFEAGWLLGIAAQTASRRAREGALAGAWRDPAPDGTPDLVGDWHIDIAAFGAALPSELQRELLGRLARNEIAVRKPVSSHARPAPLSAYDARR